jgi:hypothetical protein
MLLRHEEIRIFCFRVNVEIKGFEQIFKINQKFLSRVAVVLHGKIYT